MTPGGCSQNDFPISMHLQPETGKGYVAAFLIVSSSLVSAAGRSRESGLNKASGRDAYPLIITELH